MSKDIRSYFQAMKTSSKIASARSTKRRVISSDEEDKVSQSPLKRPKKSNTFKKKIIEVIDIIDSDEDDKQQKTVSPADMFGKRPITREEAPTISTKLQKEEAQWHDDDNFEATLCQLDTSDIEQKYLSEIKVDKDPDMHKSKVENDGKKKSPAKSDESRIEKKTPSKTGAGTAGKRNETKSKKPSNSSSNEDIHHEDPEHSKSKLTKMSSKTTSDRFKVEVELKDKKKVLSKKDDDSDIYEEITEKKKQHAALYQQYLQRGGARNPGSKEIPTGADICLAGLSFLITGVLDSLEREEAEELIKKYGGRLLHQVSKNTDYVIIGDQPGPSKLSKAKSLNVKQISEGDLLEMIRTRPAGRAHNVKQSRVTSKDRSKLKSTDSEDALQSPPKKLNVTATEKAEETAKLHSLDTKEHQNKETEKLLTESPQEKEHDIKDVKAKSPIKKVHIEEKQLPTQSKDDMNNIKKKTDTLQDINGNVSVQALVEKYRPKTIKQILGQQGDKSNARKLYNWLNNWHKNRRVKHTKPSPWATNDDGGFYKGVLLSGPPGIGKTTTAQVVCNELGFDLVEFNASDTRSKKLLQAEVSELLSNTSLKNYFTDAKSKPTAKHVLLMDEVDGMAGNEDRGGLQELISLIKSSDIPIICICNDRSNPKMRTLSNHTFDLRFPKPRTKQISAAMKSMCFKERIQISSEDLDRLIESTDQDIRQVINQLALFVGHAGDQEKSGKKNINKDLRLGPWNVVKKVFSIEEHKHMSIHDKSALFFHDYSLAPLFVQENYLLVVPKGPTNTLLEKIAKSAESLALGDVVEKCIRSNNAWSLLPVQACYSSVIPGSIMSGYIGGDIRFPSWFGRNSKAGKFNRLTQEITLHARLVTGASKEAINLDYVKPLRNAIVRPLAVDGVENVGAAIDVMKHYHLLREDLDTLIELSLWPGDRDPMQVVDSKVKAAFTRTYNKNSVVMPYITSGTSKKKTTAAQDEGILEEETGGGSSDENDENVETDKMIKAKTPSAGKKAEAKGRGINKTKTTGKSSSDKPSKRGRGRGRGK